MRRSTGFTLVEILVVVVIIGILAALAVPAVVDRIAGARIEAAKSDLRTIEAALSMCKLDNHSYPPTEIGLRALVERPPAGVAPNWNSSAYLKKLPRDPWGNPYGYQHDSATPDVYTLGAVGKPGGSEDAADIHWRDL